MISKLRHCQQGVGAVEFSFCFPIVLAVCFLGHTYWNANQVTQSLSYASNVAVDLVTRHHNLSDESFERLYRITEAIAGPGGDSDDFTIRIASISNPFNGDYDNSDIEIDWVRSNRNGVELEDDDLDDLDLPTISPGDSVIIVSISASYTLPFVETDISTLQFAHQSIRRPRFVNRIPIDEET